MTACGPSRGCRTTINRAGASRRVPLLRYETRHRSKMNWRLRLMISAANAKPMGGFSDDWLERELGNFWREAQVW